MNIDDLKLASILKDGAQGDVVIIGAPFDYARKRCINKGGEDNGPCCLRRFFGKVGSIVNAEYSITLQKIKVSDYGNIDFNEQVNSQTPEKCINKIGNQIFDLLKNNKVPFVLGGSKESLLGSTIAFNKKYLKPNHILISGKPSLKRPFDQNKLTSQNILTIMAQNYPNQTTLFGASKRYFPQHYNQKFEYISLEQIRNRSVKNEGVNTQAGAQIKELLNKLDGSFIQVSLTVEAIERFRGCRDLLSVGLTVQEVIQIFFLMGSTDNIKLVDISEFNPSVQDYESSLLLVNLLYYFLLGWTKRKYPIL